MLTSTHGWGGVESHTVAVAQTLAKRGHKVSIVQLGHQIYERVKTRIGSGVEIAYVPLPTSIDKIGFLKSLHLLGQLERSLCIFPKGHFGAGSWVLDIAARLSFRGYITVEHSPCDAMPLKSSKKHLKGMLPGIGWWWFRILLKRRLRSLAPNRIVCVSEAVKARLIEHSWFPPGKVVTIHNGIDPYRFRPLQRHRYVKRSEWGIPHNAFIFGALGRFEQEKGYDLAVDLFGRLTEGRPEKDLWLVLVGGGTMESELRRLAEHTGQSKRIKFAAFADRPWEVYPAFDVLLFPSRIEGLGLALLESMSCGRPAVAMKVGGIPEVIVNKDLGWLVESGDKEGFFAAMKEAAETEPDRLIEMGRRARECVISKFNADKQISIFIDLMERECERTFSTEFKRCIKNLSLNLFPGISLKDK